MTLAGRATAAAGAAFAIGLLISVDARATPLGRIDETAAPKLTLTQWAYGPYGRRYWARPYGYGPRVWAGPRYDGRPFGPGVAKQRNRTRLDYCNSKPERC